MGRALTSLLGTLFASGIAVAAPCPDTPVEWRDWVNKEVPRVFAQDLTSDSLQQTSRIFEKCVLPAEAAKCTEPLRRFSRSVSRVSKPGHMLGNEVSDVQYYASMDYPEMLEVPEELKDARFLKWMDDNDPQSLDAALKYIDDINQKFENPKDKWIAFIYRSQHLATPDGSGSLGRFFVYIPHKDYDRHLQVGLQHDPQKWVANSLSVVAVQKTDPQTGEKLAVPRSRFKDFWRTRKDGKIKISTRLIEAGRLENCYDCHKNSVLPITPNPNHFDKERFGAAVKKVNGIMATYGSLQPEGYDVGAFGPGVGPEVSALRTQEFLRSCTEGKVAEARLPKIADSMKCAHCHDNKERGLLNFPSAKMRQPITGPLVHDYVVKHKRMPLGETDLSDAERAALVKCLTAEYYKGFAGKPGLLQAWLEQESCWTSR